MRTIFRYQSQVSLRNLTHVSRAAQDYFATCHPGLENVVAEELQAPEISAANIRPGKAGVHFTGDTAVLYRSNLWLRAAIRVLVLIGECELDPRRPAGDTLYEAFREVADWAWLLQPGSTFSIDGRIYGNSNFSNSKLLTARGRDAICDAIRDRRGVRPGPPPQGRIADLPLFATAFQDTLRVYRDASGESLHRRGYRSAMHVASLNEAAAAGCLLLAGWHRATSNRGGGTPAHLVDPMCGSGTFLIEAALIASKIAPGLYRRRWPFVAWPDADQAAWKDAVTQARDTRVHTRTCELWGNDIHAGALSLAQRDFEAAGIKNVIRLHHGPCQTWRLPAPPQFVMCNPPWGKRLLGDESRGWRDRERQNLRQPGSAGGELTDVDEELEEAWMGLGSFMKSQTGGADAFILSGAAASTQYMRLRAAQKWPLAIGGVDCRLLHYKIRLPSEDGRRND